MRLLRNKHTGKIISYDERLLELGRYEVVEDSANPAPPSEPEPEVVAQETPAEVAIQQAARNLLKRKAKPSGGIQDHIGASEEISIQLTRG